jgi:dTDP-4-amino-4,6-dideoxygalactose transaminase
MCEIVELQRICAEHNLILIEDAAHAHGSEWKGKRAGSFGLVGSFSFQNSKVLAAGEGGLVVTSDRQLADRIRSFANCGRTVGRPFFEHAVLGTNLRLSAFQAAILLAQLERLPQQIATRTANAQLLRTETDDMNELRWQEQPPECTQNSFYLLLGRARNTELRQRIYARLSAADVPCTPFYPHTLYQNPLYQQGGCRVMPCPVSEECITDAFWLSHNALLADEETVSQIGNIIRSAIAGQTTSVSVSSGSRCV